MTEISTSACLHCLGRFAFSDHPMPRSPALSARETEVLQAVAHGNANKEIARILGISDQTVKNHLTSILRKLEANDRTQAAVEALKRGLITL